MRPIWKGSLHLGQVVIPVGLAVTHQKGRNVFRRLHADCRTPVKEKRWCPFHETVVDDEDIVRGYELAPGEFVLVDEAELAAAGPETVRAIRVIRCVVETELDPVDLEGCYWLTVHEHQVARKPYRLLQTALADVGAVALVRFAAWGSERIGAVRAHPSGALALHTLAWPEDRIDPDPVEPLPLGDQERRELELTRELVGRLTVPIRRVDLVDQQRKRIADLVAGRPVVQPETATAADRPAGDLAEALQASIRKAPRRRKTTASR